MDIINLTQYSYIQTIEKIERKPSNYLSKQLSKTNCNPFLLQRMQVSQQLKSPNLTTHIENMDHSPVTLTL